MTQNDSSQSGAGLHSTTQALYRKWAQMADEAAERMRERSQSILEAPDGRVPPEVQQRMRDELTSLRLFAESMHAEAEGNGELAAERRQRAKEFSHDEPKDA